MALEFPSDSPAADWLLNDIGDPDRLVVAGPMCYEAYARLLFVPDPETRFAAEADITLPDEHPTEVALVASTVRMLAATDPSSNQLWFCIWDGYSDMPLPVSPSIDLGIRQYALARGTFSDWLTWSEQVGVSGSRPPAFMWPDDRSWCMTSDVDPHWAVIGATASMITGLLTKPELPILPMNQDDDPPRYGS